MSGPFSQGLGGGDNTQVNHSTGGQTGPSDAGGQFCCVPQLEEELNNWRMEILLENKNAVIYGAGGAIGGAEAKLILLRCSGRVSATEDS
jgi:hypothetical protein